MRTTPAKKSIRLRLDRAVVFVAFLLLGALALSSPLLAGINGMRVAGCRSACDTSLVGAGGAVIMAGCIGVTMIAFTVMLVLPRPDRYLWWLPCSALAIAVAILLIGDHLIDLGVGACSQSQRSAAKTSRSLAARQTPEPAVGSHPSGRRPVQ